MNLSTELEGLKIKYTRQKAADVRQRVLLIHGTGCDGRVFKDLSLELSKKDDVVAIDLPGHGESEGAGFRGVADYASFCSGLIADLGWEDCVVVGHSLGGGVAIATVLYDFDLVKSLVLIDSGARLRVSPEVIQAARLEAAGNRKRDVDSRVGFSDKTSYEVIKKIRDITKQCSPQVTLKDWIADDTCDFMSRVGKIDLPTLAICGREDELTPLKYHQYLSEQMPNCILSVIEDAGHWSFVEKPKEVIGALNDFLDQLS